MAAAFTQDNLDLLEKTIQARKTLMSGIEMDKIKGDPEMISVALSVLDSIDKTIVNVAKVRVDETGVKNMAEIQERSADLIRTLHGALNRKAHARVTPEVPTTVKAKDVPGNKFIGNDDVSISDFQK